MTANTKKPENPPAFPQEVVIDDQGRPSTLADYRSGCEGMTLRDYFIGQLIGSLILASQSAGNVTRDDVVGEAGKYADAMLAERIK